MVQKIETIIIGGGQAGLATSYYLSHYGLENIVLEQASKAGNAWRNERWDSFTLLTPNWSFQLPGACYQGQSPEGFMPRDEIVSRFEKYIEEFHISINFQVRVNSVEQNGNGYLVKTKDAAWEARNVVMATGLFQGAKIPLFSTGISSDILQLHSGEYRNPQSLPAGGVLVVGTAQSGCQIAEELYQSGRKVFLCVGTAGRVPRRYRGKDVYEWMNLSGFLDRTVDKLPSPAAKFWGNPHVTGKDGGRTLNLHQFARDGVILLGHLQNARDDVIWLAPDLNVNLAKVDKFETEIVKMIDGYISQSGLNVPTEKLPELTDGYQTKEISDMNLRSAGIKTIIWAVGYKFDFSLVKLPIFDFDGFPIQQRGVTDQPGIFFVGLPWLYKYKSGHLIGVGEDANYIASAISARHS
jgi:putative flavoprotein involved in K+ transport